jgi:D-alanine-D-alanine ligase
VFESDISPDNLTALDRPCDLVFPALHGIFGEDGQLQEVLERRGMPFVGSGSAASRLGMNKAMTKSCLLEHSVPTAPWEIVQRSEFNAQWTPNARVGLPCVIKPICEGSSVGCKICRDLGEARAHLALTLPKYGAMMAERFIDGMELTVGILDGETLPVIWIKPTTTFYDYEAKYNREDTQYVFDIPLQAEVLAAVRKAAAATHRHLGCRHLSRVDVMVENGSNAVWVLETNTMPGFTGHSLVPKAAQHAGIPFAQLCDRLARMALRDAGGAKKNGIGIVNPHGKKKAVGKKLS